jgi:hypothetical protein
MSIPATPERIRRVEPGARVGVSGWMIVTQQRISGFGATTTDEGQERPALVGQGLLMRIPPEA